MCTCAPPGGGATVGGGGGSQPTGGDNTNNGNNKEGINVETLNGATGGSFLPEAIAQLVQVAEGQIEGEIYYILIENLNNETRFVPDKVTISSGYTVVWINNDSTKDHRIVITDENGKPLLNSVVSYNNFINYKFESNGVFYYSDFGNSGSNGIMTVVADGEDDVEISGPLPGIETIISSLGFK